MHRVARGVRLFAKNALPQMRRAVATAAQQMINKNLGKKYLVCVVVMLVRRRPRVGGEAAAYQSVRARQKIKQSAEFEL